MGGSLCSCFWFRASLIYINNCPTRCNTKQSICYFTVSLYMFWVSTTPIIRIHKTVTIAAGTGHAALCSYLLPTWPSLATLEGGNRTKNMTSTEAEVTVLCTPDDGCVLTPETCVVNLQNNK